jgi:hypothetical protein
MARIFGVCCHSPDELIRDLHASGRKADFHILAPGALISLDKKIRKPNILIVGSPDISKNWRAFNHPITRNKNIFLFDGHPTLLDYTGIRYLDLVRTKTANDLTELEFLDFLDLTVIDRAKERPVKRRKTNYVNSLIEDTRKGSVLNALMTFIYMLPPKTHQKPVRILCARFFIEGWSSKKLLAKLDALNETLTITKKMRDNLLPILSNPVSLRLQQAFAESKSMEDADVVAKKHEVSAYEMRYLLQSLKNDVEKKIDVDQYMDKSNDKSRKRKPKSA